MKQSTTRRAVVAGLAAAPAVALPAVALDHPDAELLALGRELEEAQQAVDAAEAHSSTVADRIAAMIPPRPDPAKVTQEYWNWWRDRQEEACAQCGSEEANATFSAACEEVWDIHQEIIATPANTIDGLCLKVRAIEMCGGIDDGEPNLNPDEWPSIANDIRRLAGKAVAS